MSLKTFHIFFISLSSIFTFGFGVWLLQSFSTINEIGSLIGAILAFLSGVGLIIYGIRFLRKLQHVRFL